MVMHLFELIGTAVFAITGVLAVTRRGLDLVGALALGVVTAVGGGTVRDLVLDVPVFWLTDRNYLWAAAAGAVAAFSIGWLFRSTYRPLLYLDGLGAALFAVTAADRVLEMGFASAVAVVMGVLTAIGGGLVRDVLAGRQTLLMSREIYATPILIGCTVFVLLQHVVPTWPWAAPVGFAVIFGLRGLAIHQHLEMPAWLTSRDDGTRH